jgi:hypothetical protein
MFIDLTNMKPIAIKRMIPEEGSAASWKAGNGFLGQIFILP